MKGLETSENSLPESEVKDKDILEVVDVQPEEKLAQERNFLKKTENIQKEISLMESDDGKKKRSRGRRMVHSDGRPIVFADDFDICDCLQPKCKGCHYPCKVCSDRRCGVECRVHRKWVYDTVEVEGRNLKLKHPSTQADV